MIDSINSSFTITKVGEIVAEDKNALQKAEKSYGDSWKKRGGVGAMMMLARKWDRIENQVKEQQYDIFNAIEKDINEEGIIDDIRDLRRYLLLVEAEMLIKGVLHEFRRKDSPRRK
tara:strand:- start:626 stop:973 length:348 start_codon:yes stop_codon:yes gene_type:complete